MIAWCPQCGQEISQVLAAAVVDPSQVWAKCPRPVVSR